MDSRKGWCGSLEESCAALELLFANGRLAYTAKPNEPADEDFIVEHLPGLTKLFATMPKGNGTYSVFVKTMLKLWPCKC